MCARHRLFHAFSGTQHLLLTEEPRNYTFFRHTPQILCPYEISGLIGYIGERLFNVVFVDREGIRRIIRLRKANLREHPL